jgi:hypothetical protein
MVLNYFKGVSKLIYLRIHVKNKELMDFLDQELKRINPQLSLTTTLSQLSDIDPLKRKLMQDTEERLRIAPSKTIALRKQIKETLKYLDFREPLNTDKKDGNDNYLNEYRKISYDHLSIGDDVTLQGLGYLLFNEHWERTGEEELFKGLTIISSKGLKISLNAIGEGAAFAYHLPYLADLLNQIATTGQMDQITTKEKPSVVAYAIMHVYLNSPITPTNKDKFGKSYGFKNGKALYNKYGLWRNDHKRMLNSESTASNNRRIENFKMAVNLLKLLHPHKKQAFEAAQNDLNKLLDKI